MNRKLELGWTLLRAFVVSIVFIAIPILIGPVWEVNDDPAIAFLLSRQGNNYSPFQWRTLSVLLNFLYINLPIIDWWAVCNFTAIWASAFVFVFVAFRRYACGQAVLISLAMLVILWFSAIQRLNFTRTAAAVAIAGCLLIADSIFVATPRRIYWGEFVVGCLLLLFGASIRNKSALIALGFLALIGFVRLITDGFKIKTVWIRGHLRQIAMLWMAAIVFFGAWGLHQLLLTPEQREYEEYNALRSSIQDYSSRYPAYEETPESYEAAGISQYAYAMFLGWFSEDTEVYSAGVLENISELGTQVPKPDFSAMLSKQKLVTFITLLLMLSLSLRRWQNWFRNIVVGGAMILCCLYLSMTGRIPARVYQSLLLVTSASAMFLSGWDYPSAASKKEQGDKCGKKHMWLRVLNGCRNVLIMTGLAAVVGLGLWRANNLVLVDRASGVYENEEALALANRDFLDQIDTDREHIYMFDIYYNPASVNSAFSFWEVRPEEYCVNRFDLGGWDPRHPYYVNLLDERGVINPAKALFERTDVYSTYSPRLLLYLQTYYDLHMTASGTKKINDKQLVQYTQPIDDSLLVADPTKTAVIEAFYHSDSQNSGAWYLSAEISDSAPQERIFYCNIDVGGARYTYRLSCEGSSISGTLYGIDGTYDPGTAQIRFFEKTDNGYTEYRIVPPAGG